MNSLSSVLTDEASSTYMTTRTRKTLPKFGMVGDAEKYLLAKALSDTDVVKSDFLRRLKGVEKAGEWMWAGKGLLYGEL